MASRPEEPEGSGEAEERRRGIEEPWQFFDTSQESSSTYAGSDPAGVVHVTVGDAGRVHEVEVGETWRQLVGVEGLEPAVREAVNEAVALRLAAVEEEEKREREAQGISAEGSRELDESEDPAALALGPLGRMMSPDLCDRLNQSYAKARELERRAEEGRNREVQGISGASHVAAVMRAGRVTRFEVDPRWLEDAGATSISVELREALQSGHRKARAVMAACVHGNDEDRELFSLTSNPDEILRRLGTDDLQ